MKYASTFLSHNSANKALVETVAHELGRRGIIAWLDKNDFVAGAAMDKVLEEAIARQTTFTVFLSEQAIKSPWVQDELEIALEKEKKWGKEIIVPIYLGDRYKLVKSHTLLRSRWLDHRGTRVTRLGIESSDAVHIADELARRVYTTLEIPSQRTIIIYIDQRGTAGKRSEEPLGIPENLSNLNAPALVFVAIMRPCMATNGGCFAQQCNPPCLRPWGIWRVQTQERSTLSGMPNWRFSFSSVVVCSTGAHPPAFFVTMRVTAPYSTTKPRNAVPHSSEETPNASFPINRSLLLLQKRDWIL